MKYRRIKIIGIYTIIFAFIALALMLWFRKYGISFVQMWDANDQYFPILTYLRKFYREIIANFLDGNFSITMFNFNFGYGFDVIQGLFYYGIADPLNFMVVLVPENGVLEYYEALVFIRLYLAGLFYILMCFYFKKVRIMTAITAFIYIFGGFAIYAGVVHPFFINAMIYLPLFIIGIDRIICGKSPVLFIISVFLIACTGFYFAYMVTVIMAFYAVIRVVNYCWNDEHRWKKIFGTTLKGMGYYILGLLMAMAIFLPGMIGYLNSTRATDLAVYNLVHYPLSEYRNNFVNLLSVEFDDDGLSLSVVSILAMISLVFRGKRKITLGLLITGGILYLLPFGGYIFNGFATVTQRWIFALLLLIAYITLDGIDDIKDLKRGERIAFIGFMIVYAINMVSFDGATKVNKLSLLVVVVLTVIMLVVMNPKSSIIVKNIVIAGTIVTTVGINLVLVYSGKGLGIKSTFKSVNVEDEITNHAMAAVATEDMTYRVEAKHWINYNIGLADDYAGIRTYVSMIPSSVSEYVCVLENAGQTTDHSIYGLDYRSALFALNSVKYLVAHQGAQDGVTYGYELAYTKDCGYAVYDVYENQYFLPLGYTYDRVIDGRDFNEMNALQKQDAMMQGIYLEGFNDSTIENLNVENNLIKHNYSVEEGNGVTIKNGKIHVDYAGAYITLKFDAVKNSETYVCFNEIYASDEQLDIYVEAEENISRIIRVKPSNNRHYYGQSEYTALINYSENGYDAVNIKFMTAGEFDCSEIEVYSYEMNNFKEYTAELSKNSLENISITQNKITGDISVEEDKILCLAIPYSAGWTIKVDGVETSYYQGNIMHMAIMLEAGEHSIECSYETPGLKLGIALSAIGFAGFIALIIIRKHKSKASIL